MPGSSPGCSIAVTALPAAVAAEARLGTGGHSTSCGGATSRSGRSLMSTPHSTIAGHCPALPLHRLTNTNKTLSYKASSLCWLDRPTARGCPNTTDALDTLGWTLLDRQTGPVAFDSCYISCSDPGLSSGPDQSRHGCAALLQSTGELQFHCYPTATAA